MVRHRLATGRWLRIHAGVFALLGTQMNATVLVHAAVLAAGGDAAASHATAAVLLGIPGFALEGSEINVTAGSYTKRRRTPARMHGTLGLPAITVGRSKTFRALRWLRPCSTSAVTSTCSAPSERSTTRWPGAWSG